MQQGKTGKILYKIPWMVCLVQMITAALWIALCGVKKMGSYPAVLETAAENRTEVVSEYTGLLYPVFLRFFSWIFGGQNVPGMMLQYCLQGMVLFFGIRCFCKVLCHNKEKTYLLTCLLFFSPFVMQTVFLASSECLTLALAFCFFSLLIKSTKSVKSEKKYSVFLLLGLYLLIVLFNVEDASVLGIVWLVVSFAKNKKKKGLTVIGLILFFAVVFFLLGPIYRKNSGEIPGNRLGTGFLYNVAFEHMESDYYFWPDDIKEIVPFSLVHEVRNHRGEFGSRLAKSMEAAGWDEEERRMATWQIALASVKNRSKDTVTVLLKQFTENLFAPFTLLGNFIGTGKSNTAYELYSFGFFTHPIAKLYFFIGLGNLFFVIFMQFFSGGFALFLGNRKRKQNTCEEDRAWKSLEEKKDRREVKQTLICWMFVCAAWNAIFQMRYFDYIAVLPVLLGWMCLWNGWEISEAVGKPEETASKHGEKALVSEATDNCKEPSGGI